MLNRRNLLKCVPLLLAGCSPSPPAPKVLTRPPKKAPLELENVQLGPYPITVDLPLLTKVWELDDELRAEPDGFTLSDSRLYLCSRLQRSTDWCAARNGLVFGDTTGDGKYFSFLVTGTEINATTPVFVTCPANSGEKPGTCAFLADGFENFIRLGLSGGFFFMEQFVFQPQKTVQSYAAMSVPLGRDTLLEPAERKGLDEIARRLDLTPLAYTWEEFEALQKKYKPLLAFGV
jgi:hypothetical protein